MSRRISANPHRGDEYATPGTQGQPNPRYDYATPNYYFVTICTHEKQCIFGTPLQQNTGSSLPMIMAQYKSIVSKKLRKHFPGRTIWQKSYYDRVIRNEQEY